MIQRIKFQLYLQMAIHWVTNLCVTCSNISYMSDVFCDPFHKAIELPPTLNTMQGPAKQELQKACAIHSNARTKYAVAALLYQEAIKTAQSYEQQANAALTELTDLTTHVQECLDIAMSSVESAPCKSVKVERQQSTILSFLHSCAV
jgi:hypothetical protein